MEVCYEVKKEDKYNNSDFTDFSEENNCNDYFLQAP